MNPRLDELLARSVSDPHGDRLRSLQELAEDRSIAGHDRALVLEALVTELVMVSRHREALV
jgi:hypothetical protein